MESILTFRDEIVRLCSDNPDFILNEDEFVIAIDKQFNLVVWFNGIEISFEDMDWDEALEEIIKFIANQKGKKWK